MGGARTICCYHVFPSLAHEKGLFHITSNWFIAVILIFLFLPVEIKPITVGIIRFYRIWLLGKLILRKKGFFSSVRLYKPSRAKWQAARFYLILLKSDRVQLGII